MPPATSSPPVDLKISPKAKIIDARPKAPASPLALAPSSPRPPPVVSPADKKPDNAPQALDSSKSNLLTTIDMDTFYQILDLDDDDETHDFSRGMAWAYFSQVDTTFQEMDDAFSSKDLGRLSALGHFLKGSSAALGVAKVQASCELLQHYGQLRDQETGKAISHEVALTKIGPLLTRVKAEYGVAERWLKNWYAENAGGDYESKD